MAVDWTSLHNPFLDLGAAKAARDPALIYTDGIFRCFYTAAWRHEDAYRLSVEMAVSRDLLNWETQPASPVSPLNFSSPGNILRVGKEWVLCVQSYPIDPGSQWGNETSRLWLAHSPDLEHWGEPQMIYPQGCQAGWTKSHRQIDPFLVQFGGQFWCYYKTSGQLGLLVSEDMEAWREASPERPVLGSADTPDGVTVENPCVLAVPGGFAMLFAPCRPKRGIGLAYSQNLIRWQDVHYLDIPNLPWAANGPTAAMALDLRPELGAWLMAFHGERIDPHNAHSAALALAWSRDLEHCEVA